MAEASWIPNLSRTDRICIAGLPETGKTTLLKWLTANLVVMSNQRLYIVDPLDQYAGLESTDDKLKKVVRVNPYREVIEQRQKGVVSKLLSSVERLNIVAEKLHHINNVTLVIEEAEEFLPQGRAIPFYTMHLLHAGRNWGIGIWVVTQRIQDIDKKFFGRCRHLLLFQCGFDSFDYLSNFLHKDFIRKPLRSEFNKNQYGISTLPPHHFLHFDRWTQENNVYVVKGKSLEGEKKLTK